MQFLVPQFIEVEDKIVGPLTLRQFFYIAGAAGIAIIFWAFNIPFSIKIIFVALILTSGAALAFLKVNGQPLPQILLFALRFQWEPKIYQWKPNDVAVEKNMESLKEAARPGIDLEKLVLGLTLKSTWRRVQTGSGPSQEEEDRGVVVKTSKSKEVYQVFRAVSGERKAARRVDYS